MSDREAKVRLDVEKTGDTDAFREAKEGIEQLDQAAQAVDAQPLRDAAAAATDLQNPLEVARTATEGLAQSLDQLSPEQWDCLNDAISDTNTKLEELARAEGPEQQREAAERLTASYDDLRAVVAESFDSGDQAAQRFLATVADLERVSSHLADPFAASMGQAEQAKRQLEESIDRGFRGSEQRVAMARLAVEQYRRELEEAARAGEDTSGQQAALQQLEERYRSATRQVGEFRAQQTEARREITATTASAGGQVRQLRGLGDAFASVGGKTARFAGVAGAVVGTFVSFYRGTRRVVEGLKEYGIDIDATIQRHSILIRATERLVAGQESAAAQTQRMANMMNVLRAQGIDPTNMSLEEMERRFDEVGRSMQRTSLESAAAERTFRAFLDGLGETTEAVQTASGELETMVTQLLESGKELNAFQIEGLVKQIDAMTERLERAGEEVPEVFSQMREQAAAQITRMAKDFQSRGEAVPAWLERLQKRFAEAAGGAQGLGTAADTLKPKLADLADPTAAAAAATEDLAKGLQGAKDAMSEGEEAVESTGSGGAVRLIETFDEAGKRILRMTNVLDDVEEGMAESERAVEETKGAGAVRLEETFDEAGKRILHMTNQELPQVETAMAAAGGAASSLSEEIAGDEGPVAALEETTKKAKELPAAMVEGADGAAQALAPLTAAIEKLVGLIGQAGAGLRGLGQIDVTGGGSGGSEEPN